MLPLDKSPAVSALHPSVSPYIIPVQGTSKLRSRHHWYGGIVWSDSFSAPDMHIFVGKHMNSKQKRGPNKNSIHARIKLWGKTSANWIKLTPHSHTAKHLANIPNNCPLILIPVILELLSKVLRSAVQSVVLLIPVLVIPGLCKVLFYWSLF